MSSSTNNTSLSVLQASPALIDSMIAAASQVRFQGTRRFESHWKVGTTRYDLEYRERVSADGQGQFTVEPLDLIAPDVSTGQEDLFLLLSRAREGFNWRYRDFRIHHKPTFLRNYEVVDSGAIVQRLGYDCASLRVQRRSKAQVVYLLEVELGTGVVLSCRTETPDGALLELAEYESFELAPDLSQVAWHQPAVDEIDLVDPSNPTEIGGGAHQPRFVDGAFVQLAAQKITSTAAQTPNQFARYVYTDGLEVVFFLYGGALAPQSAGAQRVDDVVQVPPSVGPWQLVVATIHGERLIGMGRLNHEDLLDLVASALY